MIDLKENNSVFFIHTKLDFRKKNNLTSHAINTLVERITKALDTGKYVMGVFLDIKKAFDTVDHNILLEKLKLYGIRGNILRWFKSYLTEISQYVEYNNCKSEKKFRTHGVPQG